MNFFEAQDRSRRQTRQLILLMTLAVVAVAASVTAVIVVALWLSGSSTVMTDPVSWAFANSPVVSWTFIFTVGFIGFASLYRITTLRQGGGRVARDLGGTRISPGDAEPLHRQLHNVVEEIAIASGVPVPEVYVLEQEAGINAFAAGFGTEDAAIAVTRGTLDRMSRDELQGVIAHEFSHILNGDMRLNIRLMGPLFGILAIGLLGRMLLRNSGRTRSRGSSKGNGVAVLLALGIGLSITGYVGLLAARLIKAGVSRQREYLADASAVQFTRQSEGIAGALKKIGGYSEHSALGDSEAEEVSHMLFASGLTGLSGMLATHPPLVQRIQALDPSFTQAALDRLRTETASAGAPAEPVAPGVSSLVGNAPIPGPPTQESLLQTIGNPADHHVAAAQAFRRELPNELVQAIRSDEQAMLLTIALILHSDDELRDRQFDMLNLQLGESRGRQIRQLHAAIAGLQTPVRLPLLELTLPTLKSQPASRQDFLQNLLLQLAQLDNRIELSEYALLRTVGAYLRRAADPGAPRRWRRLDDPDMQAAAAMLIHIYSSHGHPDTATATAACEAGLALLGRRRKTTPPDDWVAAADKALLELQSCVPGDRKLLVRALLATGLHDGTLNRSECELLRAICGLLECPMPPILELV